MFFKNAIIHQVTDFKPVKLKSEVLAPLKFQECPSVSTSSIGFVNPVTGEADTDDDLLNLAHELNGNIMLAIRQDEKVMPKDVINRKVKKLAAAKEQETGEPLPKKELKQLSEQVFTELLPNAMVKSSVIYGFINKETGLLFIDTGSAKKAEIFIGVVRKALSTFPAVPVDFDKDVSQTLTNWMVMKFPEGLRPMDSLSLKLPDDGQATFKHVDLSTDEIKSHIDFGGEVKKIDLCYADRVSFSIQDDLIIKKIRFMDAVLEDYDIGETDDKAAMFDADFIINSAILLDLYKRMSGWFSDAKQIEEAA